MLVTSLSCFLVLDEKKINTNICPILSGYGVMGCF